MITVFPGINAGIFVIRIESSNDNWVLSDGNGDKASTNGTWLFVDDAFMVHNQMVFKAGQTLFQCCVKDENI